MALRELDRLSLRVADLNQLEWILKVPVAGRVINQEKDAKI
jgi:hypothetical protein